MIYQSQSGFRVSQLSPLLIKEVRNTESGNYVDANPLSSPDGNSFFFKSRRPVPEINYPTETIWVIRKTEDGWTEPEPFGYPFHPPYPFPGHLSWQHSITQDGTIYFGMEDSRGYHDVWYTRHENGGYQYPEPCGDSINTEHHDWEPFIASDESYLIFASRGRPDSYGSADLYISFRKADGTWTQSKNMGSLINTSGDELWSCVSPDEKYFFFTSGDNVTWNSDVYWVDAEIIENLKPDELK